MLKNAGIGLLALSVGSGAVAASEGKSLSVTPGTGTAPTDEYYGAYWGGYGGYGGYGYGGYGYGGCFDPCADPCAGLYGGYGYGGYGYRGYFW